MSGECASGWVRTRAQMAAGFKFYGERVPLSIEQRGIWKPASLGCDGAARSTYTAPAKPGLKPKYDLEGKVEDSLIDGLVNIALIGSVISIRIKAKEPMNYIAKYQITDAKLQRQFIDPGIKALSAPEYEGWLRERAQTLADQGNTFLAEFGSGLR